MIIDDDYVVKDATCLKTKLISNHRGRKLKKKQQLSNIDRGKTRCTQNGAKVS